MGNKGTNKVYVLIPVIKSWPRLHRNLNSKKVGFKNSASILWYTVERYNSFQRKMGKKGTNKVYVLIPVIKSWPRLHRNLNSKK